MISHKHRCIFVHIPKTAGNSVRKAFGLRWQDHQDISCYARELDGRTFRTYFKFAIVRNPWERLLSDYLFQNRKRESNAHKLFVFSPTGVKRSFSEWLRVALADPFHYEPRIWGGRVSPHIHRWSPQVDWVSMDGTVSVDFVGRFENLDHEFGGICERVGMPRVKLTHRNRTFHWHYSWYFDDAARKLVASYYARDIEAFGYVFESRREGVKQTLLSLARAGLR